MKTGVNFVAIDLGASSGRLIDCRWDGDHFDLNEVHRFPNGGVRMGTHLYWDVLRIWSEIQTGLRRFAAQSTATPAGIGIDAWGVDYCLLDGRDRLLGLPYHYRDARTVGVPSALNSTVSSWDLFHATGVQTMEINTVFQLASMVRDEDRMLDCAQTLLMIPDLFQFLLTGHKSAEYTEASTTQLYDMKARGWATQIIREFRLPSHIFQKVVYPGQVLGTIQAAVQSECGLSSGCSCIAVASHDTAVAVAAIPDLDESSVFLSSGTWSLMGVVVNEPNLSTEAFQRGFTNEGAADGGVLLLKNLTGLWLLQECMRIWDAEGKLYQWTELVQAAQNSKPFRSLVYPSAAELQAPGNMVEAIAHYCIKSGQLAPQTPGEFARCIFESLSASYRGVIDDLEKVTGRTLTSIRVVGGGCLNESLCQMTANACGRQVIAGPVEAAALGNAMIQAIATGHIARLQEGQSALRRSGKFQSYSPARSDDWLHAYERYKSLVKRESQINSETAPV
jgi:sugar (pentulose or hexulose) kinase